MTRNTFAASAIVLFATAVPAGAHPGHGEIMSLAQGMAHPLTGLDHVLAMLSVGFLASRLGGRALWALPASFVSMMLVGAGLAASGVALPFVESAIALSVVVLGIAVAMTTRLNAGIAVAVAAAFAVFHGFAHGSEIPLQVQGLVYGAGFVAATAALHGAGLAAGLLLRLPVRAAQAGGLAMAAVGAGLLAGTI